ncbi:MAG: hypothetical protein ABS58_04680 [Mesorhizobium sp. SCN 65-20]|nr:MAG: hypothetical protein ABS58_04680 [Mesorhizobium sp. SCN 65-20]
MEVRTVYLAGAVLIVAPVLAACSTPAPDPQDMARTTTQTAPADLQLTCASAVATQASVDANKVLPVGSSQIDATKYQVELNAAGQRYNCVIDNAGVVGSVQKA